MNLESLPKFKNPEEEIAFLRQQISNKELELREKKEDFKLEEVVKEQISKYKDALPKEVLQETYELSKHDAESIVLNLEPEQHDEKMGEMLGIMNEKGLKNAMTVLSQLNDPHLEDDFHRFLVQYIKHGYTSKDIDTYSKELRGLNMTLYEVVLLESDDDNDSAKQKSLKEVISSMEQFLSGMMSVTAKDDTKKSSENYIVMEIANPNGSDQFIFYVAVPNMHKNLFEQQIISIFHNARLTEATSDYNIFNHEGISLGSYLEATRNPIYPFKTYEQFDHDPMNVVLNSFSKIQKNGEGAAIQIIFSPKDDYFNKKYDFAIEQIEKGVAVKEAIDLPETITGSLKKGVFGLFSASPKLGDDDKKDKIDTDAIERIRRKITSTVVATNIRLVASAANRADADRILKGLESSFNQFNDTTSNGLKATRVEKGALAKLFRDFSFRSYSLDNLLPLNLQEVTTLIHFHNTTLAPSPQLKQSQAVSAPAPAGMKAEGSYLGVNTYRNIDTPIYLNDVDRLRHVYVIGQTGAGKSVYLINQVIQDIQRGNGCCYIDPHGVDVMSVLKNIPPERYKDVIYFDPSYTERPFSLNMMEYDRNKPEQKIFVVNELFSIFQRLYASASPESMGPMFEQYFRNSAMLVLEDPDSGCTLLEVSRVMSNKEFRDMKLSKCKNPIVNQFWTEIAGKAGGEASLANVVPYIVSKFDVFMANDIMRPIIAQEKSSFDFREIMDNKKILLVNLARGKLGEINSNLLGMIIVGKIQMAALSRVDSIAGGFAPFYMYIDEFWTISTDSFVSIFSEARKYMLSLTVAHQYITQLRENIRDAVFGNVGNFITFRISSEDAEYLEKMYSPQFTAKDMMNTENLNAYVKMLVKGIPQKAFNLKEFYPPKGNPDIVDTLKQLSYLTYGGDRAEIEEGIVNKYRKPPTVPKI